MRLTLLASLLICLPLLAPAQPPASPAPLFDDNGTPLTIAQFVEKYIPADMPEGLGRKELQAALEDAGANWVELADALWRTSDEGRTDEEAAIFHNAIWLICRAPHLDRLELNGEQLFSILISAMLVIEPHGYDPTSELYRRYVLNYRFDDEPVSEFSWRRDFATNYFLITSTDDPGTVTHGRPSAYEMQAVINRAVVGFAVIERGYFGNLSDPLSLYMSRAGTKRELSILVAAALRSQGYAARFVRENRSGESWVEVYSGDPQDYDARAWTPVYPTAPDRTGDVSYATELCGGRITVVTAGDAFGREQVTSRYTQTGAVLPAWMDSNGDVSDFTGWAITAWNDQTGSYVPLDDLEFPSSDKDYPLDESADNTPQTYVLGPGGYRLEYGQRYPGGLSHVQVQPFHVTPNQSVTLAGYLVPPADMPQTALVERELGEFTDSPRMMHRGRYVFLIGDGGEPSLRAYELLKSLESRSSVYFRRLRMPGANDEDRKFVRDVLKVDEAKDKLPIVIVVVNGKTTMYVQGYNLNVAQWVARALGEGDG
jgi:hypothetical protein